MCTTQVLPCFLWLQAQLTPWFLCEQTLLVTNVASLDTWKNIYLLVWLDTDETYKSWFSIPTHHITFSNSSCMHVAQYSVFVFVIVEPRPGLKPFSITRPVHKVFLCKHLPEELVRCWRLAHVQEHKSCRGGGSCC